MKKVYITFSGSPYDHITEQVVRDYKQFGADELIVYDDWWLKRTEFYLRNQWLWDFREKWGFGWNCWKAFIILDAIARFPKSVVLYVDGDTRPIADLTPFFAGAALNQVFLCEAQGCLNKRFTRRDCFIAMGCDEPKYWDARHACGRFSAWRSDSGHMLCEWDTYLRNATCQGWHRSEYVKDFPEFHRHSGDQSILTILAAKYAIPLHREACQYGWPATPGCGQPEDTYPQLFIQDGNREPETNQGSKFRNV